MCGIAGIWNLDGRPIDPHAFDAFVDALRHRGPDGRGTYIDTAHGLALGHRLLAIQGQPGEGRQPRTLGGRYWITYNGEVYNFIELREELRALGHAFRTGTDTEVVLAAYAQWGEQCLYRFNGMWAFAIWDALDQRLFLAVDRFAVKSCVYVRHPHFFAFASELKALPFLERYEFRPDGEELAYILTSSGGSNTATWLKDVYRLPAGHTLTVTRGALQIKRWWNTLEHLPEPPRSTAARVERFSELFTDAVSLRLRGNAKIAIPLSGGMDSSAVLGAAVGSAELTAAHGLQCFFVKKQGELDEERFAASMARHAGMTPVVIPGKAGLDVATMEAAICAFERFIPSSDGALALYKTISESGAKVSLDGHGGDELLGGYSCYVEQALDDALRGVPNPARVLGLARINRALAVNSEALALTEGWGNTRKRVLDAVRRRRARAAGAVAATGAPAEALAVGFDSLNGELYQDVHHGFLQKILRTFDYASMAHGVEVRTPFLDWRLVTYMFCLPSDLKIGHGYTKWILRQAMRGGMPNDVRLRRSKIGFIESHGYFFNPEIVEWMGQTIASQAFQESPYWNGRQIAGVYERWRPARGNMLVGRKLLAVAQACFLIQTFADHQRMAQAARRGAHDGAAKPQRAL